MPFLLIGLSSWAWTAIATATGITGLVAANRYWNHRQGVRLAEAFLENGEDGLRAAIRDMKLAEGDPAKEDAIVTKFCEAHREATRRAHAKAQASRSREAAAAAISAS